jgi:hypothetical protein
VRMISLKPGEAGTLTGISSAEWQELDILVRAGFAFQNVPHAPQAGYIWLAADPASLDVYYIGSGPTEPSGVTWCIPADDRFAAHEALADEMAEYLVRPEYSDHDTDWYDIEPETIEKLNEFKSFQVNEFCAWPLKNIQVEGIPGTPSLLNVSKDIKTTTTDTTSIYNARARAYIEAHVQVMELSYYERLIAAGIQWNIALDEKDTRRARVNAIKKKALEFTERHVTQSMLEEFLEWFVIDRKHDYIKDLANHPKQFHNLFGAWVNERYERISPEGPFRKRGEECAWEKVNGILYRNRMRIGSIELASQLFPDEQQLFNTL